MWVVENTPKIVNAQKQLAALPPNDPQRPVIEKNIQKTLDQTETYVQSAPTNAPLLTAAADQSLQTGDIQKAQSRTAQALSNAQPGSGEWASATNEHAKISEQLGDYKTAAADSLQVLKAFPNDQDAIARYHINAERLAAAAPSAKAGAAAKKLAAAMEEPQYQPGGFRSAVNNEDPRLKLTAQNIAAARHMKDAKRLLDMGDAEGALRAASAAQAASPAYTADADVLQAQAWSVLKDLTKALVQITEAVKLFAQQGRSGDLAKAYSQRAAFQNDLKNPGAAVSDADKALESNPKLSTAYFERARGQEALGRTDLAQADIDQAAALDPSFMSDRDDFHKRHRSGAPAAAAEAARPGAGLVRLKSAGRLNVGVAVAGLLLLSLAGYVAWLIRKGSPVKRITWARAVGGARDDGPRDLNDQYRIVKKIGEGGMGTVYEGYDKSLKRPVAIKRLRPELQKNPRERARFIKEAEMVAALQHPHTVQIYTILHDDEDTHIVFEYIEGRTLHELLNASSGRHLEPRRALELLRQIAEAVDHAHDRRVIHRDLKPANVMVDERGWAKVMDFGIARQVADSLVHTTTNTIVGTPTYMAPEQSMGEVKRESDVYALGISLYEMLTGGLPFKGAEDMDDKLRGRFLAPSLLLPGLPSSIDAVIARALAPRAEDRFHSCLDLYRAAESALGQMTPI